MIIQASMNNAIITYIASLSIHYYILQECDNVTEHEQRSVNQFVRLMP